MVIIIIVVVVVVILGIIAASMYNGLVKLNVRSDEAWSDISVQLKRRYDLIPNLVSSVQGYAAHESGVFENVAKARSEAMQAQGPAATAQADNMLTGALKSLFAVTENYPELKASQNFMELQDQLVDTENKIQASRRFYNGVVRDFNTKRKVFPTKIFANMLGFHNDKEFFEVSDAEQAEIQDAPQVKF
jgi:LemA protein